jgi:hypothetical protein
MLQLQHPGGDSGLGFLPWMAIELDGSDVHPELGQRLCVSGRILRVDWLEPETLVLRGQRLWSVARSYPGSRVGRLRRQPRVGPKTFVSSQRLRCWSHLGRRLQPYLPETPALVDPQWLHFVEDYIKPSSTSRRGCGFYSLSPPLLQSFKALDLPF